MVTVERASPDALGDVRALLAGFARAVGEPVAGDDPWRRVEEAAKRGAIEFVLAREGDVPVGLGSLSLGFSTYRGSPFAVLDDVYVVPEHRRRGVARAIALALMASARRHGCASVLGGCSAADAPRWQRLGFRPIGTLMAADL